MAILPKNPLTNEKLLPDDISIRSCPSPEEHIQLANNDWILAGEIKVGDEVITSEDPQKVTFAKTIEDSPRREVLFTKGDSIVTSPSHPYFVKNKGFVDVEDLKEGDEVGDLIVSEVKPFSDGPVIHISVDKVQTYMLRGGTEENPVPALSHNKLPPPESRDPGQGFNFSDFMTAADAEELFRNMDTSGIEAGVLQKMGVPDFLTNTQVQDAINQALGATDFLSQEDVERMLQQQMNNQNIDLSDYTTSSDLSGFLTQEQIQQMIANAQMQGMTEDQILKMIQEVTGGQMSDDAIRELIAEAVAGAGGLTEQQIQQMIDAAMGGGMTAEQIQDIIAQQGYLTEDQIKAMMGESGYLGQEGVNASVQAALDAALGQGGAIDSAIAAAMQNTGTSTNYPESGPIYSPGGPGSTGPRPGFEYDMGFGTWSPSAPPPNNPYGNTNPYELMLGPFAGMTPFAGGTKTGIETIAPPQTTPIIINKTPDGIPTQPLKKEMVYGG